jgi:quercetin dioxygenase-like cupin family protein
MKSKAVLFSLIVSLPCLSFTAWGQHAFKSTAVLKSSTTISEQKIEYPETDKPEISSLLVEVGPGGETGRHMHPVPTYVHVLEGTLTVEMDDGTRFEFPAGKAFLEAVNTWHNGKNLGKTPLKFLVVFSGAEGESTLIRSEKK